MEIMKYIEELNKDNYIVVNNEGFEGHGINGTSPITNYITAINDETIIYYYDKRIRTVETVMVKCENNFLIIENIYRGYRYEYKKNIGYYIDSYFKYTIRKNKIYIPVNKILSFSEVEKFGTTDEDINIDKLKEYRKNCRPYKRMVNRYSDY